VSDPRYPPPDGAGPDEARPDAQPGAVTTATPRPGPPPSDTDPTIELEVVEADIVVLPDTDTEPEAAAPPVPPPVTVPPDEADTVELAVSDLREAARAAGVELAPDAEAPDGDTPGTETPDEAGDGDGEAELDAAGSPIDPRIRERRVEVARAQGRRRLRILLAGVAVASAVGIAWLVVQSPFLALKDVTITGTLRESPDAVRAAAGVSDGDALVFVDTGAVAQRIEALPWIADAQVSRELPNGLSITIVERQPVAWIRRPLPPGAPRDSDSPAALVDATGRVLGDELSPPVGMPEIAGTVHIGVAGSRIWPAAAARAVSLLPPALRAQVGSLLHSRQQYELVLAAPPGGAEPAADEVRLGRLEEVVAKGAAALAVLDQLAAEDAHVTYIDVRVPSAPATR
jgi:cell division protein FtsQ